MTIDLPVLANVLDRQFAVDGPNQRWVGDTTECVIGESGKLYLAAILLPVHRGMGERVFLSASVSRVVVIG